MKRLLLSVMIALMVLAPIFSTKAETILADQTEELEENVYHSYSFTISGQDVGMIFNTEYFTGDNNIINPEIAKCSVVLASAVYDHNTITTVLDQMGFSFDDYRGDSAPRGNWNRPLTLEDNDFVRYVIGTKHFLHDGEEYILYFVVIKGTGQDKDWYSNVNMGETENHKGFYLAHQDIMDDLAAQMQNDDAQSAERRIVLVTGHSRGASVANIVAGELTDGVNPITGEVYSDLVTADHVYGYTFACPNVSKSSRVRNSGYQNIYNFNNPDDFVPAVPFSEWGYGTYGQNIELSEYTKPALSIRYSQTFGRNYQGDRELVTFITEDFLPRLVPSSEDANRVIIRAGLNGLAYLLQGDISLKSFLKVAGFGIKELFWEWAEKILGHPMLTDNLTYIFDLLHHSEDTVISFLNATVGMDEVAFSAWLDSNREAVQEIEKRFDYTISSREDLEELYAMLYSDYEVSFDNSGVEGVSASYVISVLKDLYDYWTQHVGSSRKGVMDYFWDTHRSETYIFWINAMYYGYKGYYGYNNPEHIIYAAMDDYDQIKTIGASCFEGSSSVASLVMNNNVEILGSQVCRNATGLTTLVLSENVKGIPYYGFANCSSITGAVVIPLTAEYIGNKAFQNCTGITELDIPVGLINSGVQTSDKTTAYEGCKGLRIIRLTGSGEMPAVNRPSGYTSYETIYVHGTLTPWGAASLGGNDITIEIGEGITNIVGYAFYGCNNLANVSIPSTVTSIGEYAFFGDGKLRSLNLPDGLKSVGNYAFFNCSAMAFDNLTLPHGMTIIDDYAFGGCSSITGRLTIPDTVESIGTRAFRNCTGIAELDIPVGLINSGIQTSDKTTAYEGCKSLRAFRITGSGEMPDVNYVIGYSEYARGTLTPWGAAAVNGNNLTIEMNESITSIGNYAFYNCNNLVSVSIPSTITAIGDYAFGNYGSYSTINYNGCKCDWKNVQIGYSNAQLNENTLVFGWTTELEEWVWASDQTLAQGVFSCHKNGQENHAHSIDAVMSDTPIVRPTCYQPGTSERTATIYLVGETYSDTREVNVAPLGHDYVFRCFEWSADYATAQALLVCRHDNAHVERRNAEVTVDRKEPTCGEEGWIKYTASYEDKSETKTVSIAALGHNYELTGWSWADDYSSATAKFVCSHDNAHTAQLTDDAPVEEVITPATCTQDATIRYRASVQFNSKSYEDVTAEMTKPNTATGHDYQFDGFEWTGYTAKAVYVCAHDDDHVVKYDAEVTGEVTTAPTCEENGIRTYTAAYDSHFDTRTEELPALGHQWDEAVITWTEFDVDNRYPTAAVATRTCQRDTDHKESVNCMVTVIEKSEDQITVRAEAVFADGTACSKEEMFNLATDLQIKVDSMSTAGIELSWEAGNCSKYQLYRDNTLLKTMTVNAYLDDVGRTMGSEYTYKVKGYENGEWTEFSEELKVLYNPFVDVPADSDSFIHVAWAYNRKIVNGVSGSNNLFNLNGSCKRTNFCFMLWNMMGKPDPGKKAPFTDLGGLSANNVKAITWCYNQKIVNGTSTTTFNPNGNVSRKNLAIMLWKLAGQPKVTEMTCPYTDLGSLSSNNQKAIIWCYNKGLINSITGTRFEPGKAGTRALLVEMLYGYNQVKSNNGN